MVDIEGEPFWEYNMVEAIKAINIVRMYLTKKDLS
jgi:hypothetical protein